MSRNPNVGARLQERAAEHPERLALAMPDRRAPDGWTTLTYAALDRRSDRFAHGLRAKGVRRGDRVLLLVKPSPDFYGLLFGLIKLGAVPILLDPGMGLKNVLACIAQIRPRVVIALPAVHVIRLLARRPFASAEILVTAGRRWFWGGLTLQECVGEDAPFAIEDFAPTDEVGIVFTSGSTGVPKGVTYTHAVFDAVATVADARLGRVPGRVYLETFAAYVLFDVAQGMTSVVPDMNLSKPATVDPARLIAAIHHFRPEGVFASPVVLRKLFGHCEANGLRLDGVKDVLTGVAPIPGALHTSLRALATDATLHVTYGATEGMTATHTDSEVILGETWALTEQGHGNCVGTPFPDSVVRIIGITDDPIPAWSDDLCVPDGEIGEIVLEGPVVSPEYKDRPDANALAKIRRGDAILHRMGDLGYFDAQGRLWFCGRKAHRVQTADGMIPAVPPEGVFNAHPAVFRTALVGWGAPGTQEPVLCVELKPGATWSDALGDEILARAAGTRWEGRVHLAVCHPSFPVDARHNSKIRREALAEWASGQLRTQPKRVEAK